MKFRKKILLPSIIWLFLLSTVLAWKVTNWSTYDMIAKRFWFTSDGTSWGTSVMDINSWGTIIAYWPLLDSAGNRFITGSYVSLANSWVYFNTNSGVYFETNSGTYFLTNSWSYFDTNFAINSWTYFENNSGTYFLTNSWIYFDTYSWTYFDAHSGDYYNAFVSGSYVTIADSGAYYDLNPAGYITGASSVVSGTTNYFTI